MIKINLLRRAKSSQKINNNLGHKELSPIIDQTIRDPRKVKIR